MLGPYRFAVVGPTAALAVAAALVATPSPASAAVTDEVQFVDRISFYFYDDNVTVWQQGYSADPDDVVVQGPAGATVQPHQQLMAQLDDPRPYAQAIPEVEFHTASPLDDGGRFILYVTLGLDIMPFEAVDPGEAGLRPDALWLPSDVLGPPAAGGPYTLSEIDALHPRVGTGAYLWYDGLEPYTMEWAIVSGITWVFTPLPYASTVPPARIARGSAASTVLETGGLVPGAPATATISGPAGDTAITLLPNVDGAVHVEAPTGSTTPAGPYRITISSALPYRQGYEFDLVDELAATGTDGPGAAAASALALLGVGAGVLLIRRRGRRRRPAA